MDKNIQCITTKYVIPKLIFEYTNIETPTIFTPIILNFYFKCMAE